MRKITPPGQDEAPLTDLGLMTPNFYSKFRDLCLTSSDEFLGNVTFDPAVLAAGASRAETGNTISITPSKAGDRVVLETSADLQGIQATAYVSATNVVTIRLTNPTGGAIDLGSMKFTARVRPY